MQKYILDKRLLAAAGFVPHGAVLADIGSDHAYLPIHLAQAGKIERALASDINLERSRRLAVFKLHFTPIDVLIIEVEKI